MLGGQVELGREEMATNIDDKNSIYQQALDAYSQQDYQVAAKLIDQAIDKIPNDANSHLLRGHIYYVLEQFEIAKTEYNQVFNLTEDPETLASASSFLEQIEQFIDNTDKNHVMSESNEVINSLENSESLENNQDELLDLGINGDLDDIQFDMTAFDENALSLDGKDDMSSENPFNSDAEDWKIAELTDESLDSNNPFVIDEALSDLENSNHDSQIEEELDSPFSLDKPLSDSENGNQEEHISGDLELPLIWQENLSEDNAQARQRNLSIYAFKRIEYQW